MPSPLEAETSNPTMMTDAAIESGSQYSSCETLDSHRSSEYDEKNGNDEKRSSRKISVEHTEYIVKERVTRAAPPKPAYNPMQFVAIKPSVLSNSAKEQLKKAEEIKKTQVVVRKEEPEDWQDNLDNWKSSRRKRVEHIIDRVVEVKKLEEVEHDRNRKKTKTFNELMEERGSRRKLTIYDDDDDNTIDMSGLPSDSNDSKDSGDNNSDNNQTDVDKILPKRNVQQEQKATTDDAINNNKFHSTALVKDVIQKSPSMHREILCEKSEVDQQLEVDLTTKSYTMSVSAKTTRTSFVDARERDGYDDAIEDYKNRVSKAVKLDLPKVDISKRRELFEQQKDDKSDNTTSSAASKLGTEIVSIKDRISSLRSNLATSTVTASTPPKKVDLPTSTKLKDRLSNYHQLASPVDEPKRNPLETQFKNVQDVKNELEKQQNQQSQILQVNHHNVHLKSNDDNESLESTDREDSGIQTQDVSCSQSQADEQQEQQMKDLQQVIQQKLIIVEDDSKPENVNNSNMTSTIVNNNNNNDEVEGEDNESSVIEEALDLAFQIIDNENVDSMPNNHSGDLSVSKKSSQPIYSNIEEDVAAEPHYQVPRSREPYYEVPKSPAKIPLYENVEMVFPNSSDSSRFSMAESNESFGIDDGTEMVFPIDQSKYLIMQPPKEKPPPLPEQMEIPNGQGENFKRINSTKRIKKEIRNKRSSFLGIEGQDFDDYALELSVAPPPDMQALLQEERRLEKQLYQKVGLYENSDNGESRDSGLSDNHSRQSSEPSSTSSEMEQATTDINSGMLVSEQRGNFSSYTVNEDDSRIKSIEEQINKQETYSNYHHRQDSYDDDHQEVLRVEQLLLQIEQQELKRQRENLIIRKNLARREFDEGVKLLMSNDNSSGSLNDVSNTNMTVGNVNSSPYYENVQMRLHHDHINYHNQTPNYTKNDYRKSMPNLQEFAANNWQNEASSSNNYLHQSNNQLYQQYPDDMNALSKSEMYLNSNLVPKPYQPATPTHHHHPINSQNQIYGNMTRQALMQISAVPKPKLTNDWVQYRKSEPMKPSLNSHWLIQEAEQRRIEQMNQMRTGNYVAGGGNCSNSKKPLPDAVIQTLQQRVQNSGLGVNVNKRYTVFDSKYMNPPTQQTPLLMVSQKQQQQPPTLPNVNGIVHNPLSPPPLPMLPSMDVMSVSSKKLCSYCTHELGSGAAMIIENLGLFYHIECFKCSVCQAPISDGNINGTDVRVRNSRLHCKNCFSNEEGVKFSCV